MILYHSHLYFNSLTTIYVLRCKAPLKVVIYESDATLSGSVSSKLIYALPSLLTYTTRIKASLIIIPPASTMLEVVKCFSPTSAVFRQKV